MFFILTCHFMVSVYAYERKPFSLFSKYVYWTLQNKIHRPSKDRRISEHVRVSIHIYSRTTLLALSRTPCPIQPLMYSKNTRVATSQCAYTHILNLRQHVRLKTFNTFQAV